ncbi:MAG TPA: ABC transporter substrate-binding protein [Thermoanaerobaculia bacterium]|nr:ABC transporter substrate-binding protein [Thermoanaerobaculia bacterium]
MTLVACGDAPRSPYPTGKGGGGELRVITPAEPASLNPDVGNDDIAGVIGENLFDRLVSLDADSRLIPGLAESWSASPDGRSYTFHLRRGVLWHDGRPCTSADVRWTFESLAGDATLARPALSRIASIATPDDLTVVLRLREPWSPFLAGLASTAFILPRHLLAGTDWKHRAATWKPVGTGAFRFVDWVPGERVTLAANPAYDRPGPYLDRLVYLFLPDSSRVPELMLAGAADYALIRPGLDTLPRLRSSPRLTVLVRPGDTRYYCAFNLRRAPWSDPRVRRAVNAALDRPLLVDHALAGYGAPAFGFYTPTVSWAYDGNARVPAFDRGESQRLLDAAGLPPDRQGRRLRTEIVAPSVSPFAELAHEVAAQLRAVGIDARPTLLSPTAWLSRLTQSHDFDLGLMGGSQGPDPDNLEARFGSRGTLQFMGYASPALDAALLAGARTRTPAERAVAYFRAQEILARDLPVAPLAEAVRVSVYRREVTGLPQAEARGLVSNYAYSLVRLRPPLPQERGGRE